MKLTSFVTRLHRAGRALGLLVLIAFTGWPLPASPQAAGASPLDMLRTLSPEQQKAVLESIQSGGQGGQNDQPLSYPERQQPGLPVMAEPLGESELYIDGKRRIQGGDTVLLDLRLSLGEQKPQAPAPTTTGTVPGAAPGQPGMAGTRTEPAPAEPVDEDPVRVV